jgi:hypothetical protein
MRTPAVVDGRRMMAAKPLLEGGVRFAAVGLGNQSS